jgi:hypothetical protein
MDNRTTDATREQYEPPTIEDVPLRAEERVLAGCKRGSVPSGGASGGTFSTCVSGSQPCRLDVSPS